MEYNFKSKNLNTMYPHLLALHSLVRWFVLISLLYTTFRAFRGWRGNQPFCKRDDTLRHVTATIVHVQWLIGIALYFISPLVEYFLHNFSEAVHQREVRFFGMEHSLMMFVAVVVVSAGSSISKRKPTDRQKYRAVALGFGIGLLIILLNIPWSFSPLVSRPWIRGW